MEQLQDINMPAVLLSRKLNPPSGRLPYELGLEPGMIRLLSLQVSHTSEEATHRQPFLYTPDHQNLHLQVPQSIAQSTK